MVRVQLTTAYSKCHNLSRTRLFFAPWSLSDGIITLAVVQIFVRHHFFNFTARRDLFRARTMHTKQVLTMTNTDTKYARLLTPIFKIRTNALLLADRTATQRDRLLASSCRPSVRLSVCNVSFLRQTIKRALVVLHSVIRWLCELVVSHAWVDWVWVRS